MGSMEKAYLEKGLLESLRAWVQNPRTHEKAIHGGAETQGGHRIIPEAAWPAQLNPQS